MKNLQARTQNQKGFTLVEIAIVLVIIGLLLGGVLKGQELIENSKVKSVTQDFDNIAAAYWAYRDRTGNSAGDADGDGTFSTTEFWTDLREEGFISGLATDTTGPGHALDGSFSFVLGAATGAMFTKNHLCGSQIEDSIAVNIDNKLDDGVGTSGTVKAGAAVTTAAAHADPSTGALLFVCKEL